MNRTKIKSAQYQRNGISGRPFYAAIVTNPFGMDNEGDSLVVSLDGNDGPSLTETFVISMRDLKRGELADKWRGDRVPTATLEAIRKAAAV